MTRRGRRRRGTDDDIDDVRRATTRSIPTRTCWSRRRRRGGRGPRSRWSSPARSACSRRSCSRSRRSRSRRTRTPSLGLRPQRGHQLQHGRAELAGGAVRVPQRVPRHRRRGRGHHGGRGRSSGGVVFPRWFMLGAQAIYTLGFLFAWWLFFEAYFVIGALCPWCLLITVTTTLVWAGLTRLNVREGVITFPGRWGPAARRFVDARQRLVRHHRAHRAAGGRDPGQVRLDHPRLTADARRAGGALPPALRRRSARERRLQHVQRQGAHAQRAGVEGAQVELLALRRAPRRPRRRASAPRGAGRSCTTAPGPASPGTGSTRTG